MTMVTITPNGTVGINADFVGAASTHAALSDASDTSYVQLGFSAPRRVNMTNPTKPAGSMLWKVQPRARIGPATPATLCAGEMWLSLFGGYEHAFSRHDAISIIDVSGPQSVRWFDLPQVTLDGIEFEFRSLAAPSAIRWYKADVDVWFADQPSTTIVSPASGATITSADFDLVWQHTPGSPDGFVQAAYQWLIYTEAQYNGAGFTPGVTPALIASGPWHSRSGIHGVRGVPQGAIRAYVRTAQSVNGMLHWAPWVFFPYTVTYARGEVLDVAATAASATGAISVTVNRDTGSLAWTRVHVQANEGVNLLAGIGQFTSHNGTIGNGWAAYQFGSPTSASRSIQTGGVGGRDNHQRLVSTNTNATSYGITPSSPLDREPVEPGQVVELSIDYKGTFAATSRLNLIVLWYDALGALLGDNRVQHTPITTTVWKRLDAFLQAPDGVVEMAVIIEQTASTGTAVAATLDIDEVRWVVDGEWRDVRYTFDAIPTTNQLVLADYEASNDKPIRYRARAYTNELIGAWVEQVGTTTWTITGEGVWVKHPNPALNVLLAFGELPQIERGRPRAVFEIVNGRYPVSISDRRKARAGQFTFVTYSDTQTDALDVLLDKPVLLIQPSAMHRVDSGWWSLGDTSERHIWDYVDTADPERKWPVDVTEVSRPAT